MLSSILSLYVHQLIKYNVKLTHLPTRAFLSSKTCRKQLSCQLCCDNTGDDDDTIQYNTLKTNIAWYWLYKNVQGH